MLFPEATEVQFADGYTQAVTFGLRVTRARDVNLSDGMDRIATEVGATNILIGAALRIVIQEVESETALKTAQVTLTCVLDVVQWQAISKGGPDAWLYFYEESPELYDNALRKKTGSYDTPPEVVGGNCSLDGRCDPAVETGKFVLGILRHIALSVAESQGDRAVPATINASLKRLIVFEMQLGPFAEAHSESM